MFDKIKDLYKLTSQMKEIKKQLDDTIIEVESDNRLFTISISGSQEIRDVKITGDISKLGTDEIAKTLKNIINKAIRDSQATAAAQMSKLTGLGGQ